jgi:hypothetical protein
MPFGSMVGFMVKWAIASIPAMLILATFGAVVWGLVLALFVSVPTSLRQNSKNTPGSPASSGDSNKPAGSNPEKAAYLSKVLVRNVSVGKSVLGEPGVFGEVKNAGVRTLEGSRNHNLLPRV